MVVFLLLMLKSKYSRRYGFIFFILIFCFLHLPQSKHDEEQTINPTEVSHLLPNDTLEWNVDLVFPVPLHLPFPLSSHSANRENTIIAPIHHSNQWQSMEINGNQWKPMAINDNQWQQSMEIHGKSIAIHSNP
jgi:hypothetical protein